MSAGFKKEQYQFYVLSKIKSLGFHEAATAEEIIQKCNGFKPWYDEYCTGSVQDFDSCIRGTLSELSRVGIITEKGSHPKEYYLNEVQSELLDQHMFQLIEELDDQFDFDSTDGSFFNSDMSFKLIFGFDESVENDYLKFVKKLGVELDGDDD